MTHKNTLVDFEVSKEISLIVKSLANQPTTLIVFQYRSKPLVAGVQNHSLLLNGFPICFTHKYILLSCKSNLQYLLNFF